MRQHIILFLCCIGLALLPACKQDISPLKEKIAELEAALEVAKTPQPAERKTGFYHNVYFWLSPDMTSEQRDSFVIATKKLNDIPSVIRCDLGPPAMTPRKVVDNSYDFAIIVQYEDKAGHDAYQAHPLHKDLLDKYSDLIERVQIYDNLVD